MAINVGDKLPEAKLTRLGAEGPETVDLNEMARGNKIVVFAVPGAFTPTCHSAHMPSFVQNAGKFRDKGVSDIVCVSVNDPFVMGEWAKSTGAADAGIHVLADGDSSFTKAMGLEFSAPPVGLIDRSKRYAMVVEDGTVTALELEDNPGECSLSAGPALLDKL